MYNKAFDSILEELSKTIDGTTTIYAQALKKAIEEITYQIDWELDSMKDDIKKLMYPDDYYL